MTTTNATTNNANNNANNNTRVLGALAGTHETYTSVQDVYIGTPNGVAVVTVRQTADGGYALVGARRQAGQAPKDLSPFEGEMPQAAIMAAKVCTAPAEAPKGRNAPAKATISVGAALRSAQRENNPAYAGKMPAPAAPAAACASFEAMMASAKRAQAARKKGKGRK